MMQTRPVLPPKARGPLARRLAAAAARATLELPVCQECGTAQYPLRERCVKCCSGALRWQVVGSCGVVLARTAIRHSTEPYFQARRPILLCSIQLDAGPVVIAFASRQATEPGQRVQLLNRLDRSGEAMLVAVPEGAADEMGNVMSDPNSEIAGKVVLVIGAADAVGREIVTAFRKAGAREVLAAGDPSAADVDHKVSMADPPALKGLASSLASRIDILVNNLSFSAGQTALADGADQGARQEMEVNYFGLLNILRAFSPAMRARGQGVIVNVLSVWGQTSLPPLGTFSASQAACVSLTQAARAELAAWGVRVCGVFPAALDTPTYSGIAAPKLAAAQLAAAIVKALPQGVEDVYPGGGAEALHAKLRDDAKATEKEIASQYPI